jgi:hypothetical protein
MLKFEGLKLLIEAFNASGLFLDLAVFCLCFAVQNQATVASFRLGLVVLLGHVSGQPQDLLLDFELAQVGKSLRGPICQQHQPALVNIL